VASGGVHKLKIFEVSSWSRAFEYMKSAGLWVVGTAEDGDQDLYDFDLVRPLALVVGSEATGLRPVTRKFCDAVLCIPSAHALSSLNVAVAAGVALFEVRRQRGQQRQ
jgi:23S rRNA (guanosine2251-2'-O)-methyltransferase